MDYMDLSAVRERPYITELHMFKFWVERQNGRIDAKWHMYMHDDNMQSSTQSNANPLSKLMLVYC